MRYLNKAILIIFFSLLFVLSSCKDKNSNTQSNQITASVILTSTSLATHNTKLKVIGDSIALTPYNINGQALSLLFATASEIDEGLVIFGDSRPDIAPSNSTLYPFDFADQLVVNSVVNLKPGYVGGNVEHMVNMFGYIDIYVTVDENDRRFRLALSDYDIGSDSYIRGDVLLEDTISNNLRFYDLDNYIFTTTRPNNPYSIEEIRDFFDPIRPNMVYYPLNVFLDPNIYLDANELETASSIDAVVDFFVEDFVILENQTTTENISDSALINSFNITQNVIGFGNSGLSATATVVINQ
jgi:hypothetical protein